MSTDRARSPGLPSLLAAVLTLVAGGCTIGPDPYDYSGPVPNGSAPQNDFRARSNGILPLGAAPRPFPPLVDVGTPPAGTDPKAGDDHAADVVVPVSAEDSPVVVAEPVSDEQGVDVDVIDGNPASPTNAAELQPVHESLPAPLAETPGWRPRD